MKAAIYWTTQYLKRGAQECRFKAKCWWLSQRIDFLERRWRMDGRMPQPVPVRIRFRKQARSARRAT